MALLKIANRANIEAESEIIESCRQGDRDALQTVFTTHAPFLESLLSRIVGNQEEVEDLLQMTFVAAIRAFPRFRGEAQVRTWLSRIAVRIAQEQLRALKRRKRIPLSLVEHSQIDERSVAPDRHTETQKQLERLYFHLGHIAPKKRVAFILHVFEGYPVDRVAALVGASITATKSRIFWARRELLERVRKDPVLREFLKQGAVS